MKVYTSYYAKQADHPNAVAISRGIPKGFTGRRIHELKPSQFMLDNLRGPALRDLYFQKIEKCKKAILKQLRDGDVLLCWEGPMKECHRHYAAEWLNANGVETEEFKEETDQESLFD